MKHHALKLTFGVSPIMGREGMYHLIIKQWVENNASKNYIQCRRGSMVTEDTETIACLPE